MAATLTLSAADQARFAGALEALMAPLDHTDLDGWRREASRHLKALVGSEAAAFELTHDASAIPVYSEEYRGTVPSEYLSMYRPMEAHYRCTKRLVHHGVMTRDELWRPGWEEYLRSPYRNEFLVPNRMREGVTVAARVRAGGLDEVAKVILIRTAPGTVPFGEREKRLLQMLLPAFHAGVGVALRFGASRAAMKAALDGAGGALAIVDLAGRTVHATPALTALLEAEPERVRLDAAIRTAALGVAWAHAAAGAGVEGAPPPPAVDVSTGRSAYGVRASSIAEGVFGPDPVALVVVEVATAVNAPAERLRERFGLTEQETRVCLLLAERKTTAEIASALFISPHTARHHVEHVLEKLGIRSRRDVAATLAAP